MWICGCRKGREGTRNAEITKSERACERCEGRKGCMGMGKVDVGMGVRARGTRE